METARILVLTGPGKGKTSSALGMILRAAGHGKKVLLVRFCKAAFSGELAILEKLDGVVVHSGSCGMTPPPDHPEYERHVKCARELFMRAKAVAPEFDMIVLDEICGAVAQDLVEERDALDFLNGLRPDQSVILTGRNARASLVDAADTVSEIQCVKHGYRSGIEAQEGIEF